MAGGVKSGAMSYVDLNTNQMVERIVRDRMGIFSRNSAQFFRFLDFINGKKIGVKTKTIEHSIHNEQTDNVSLRATTSFGVITNAAGAIVSCGSNAATYTDTILQLTETALQVNQIIRIVGTGTAIDDGYFIDVRILTRDVGSNSYAYTVAVIPGRYRLPSSATTVFGPNSNAALTCTAHTMGTASPVDGKVPEGVFFNPDFVINNLMHTRESVVVGSNAIAGDMIADVALQQQLFLKWFKIYQDIENSLVFSTAPFQINSGNTSFMGFGGIPYYTRSHSATTQAWDRTNTQLSSDYRGQNRSIRTNGVAADEIYDMLDAAVRATTYYGRSKERVFVASPDTIAIIQKLFRDMIVINKPDFGYIDTTDLWEMPTLKLPSGNLTLLATNGLIGKRLPIDGAGFTALDASRVVASQASAVFGHIVDPMGLNMPVLEKDGMQQEFRVVPVDPTDNDTFKTAEIVGFYGFDMDDPRANGTVIFESNI